MASATPDLWLRITFLATEHRRPLVTEAHVCEQLAQGCYVKRSGRDSNLRPTG